MFQFSDYSTFRITRDVPSVTVFCSKSIECFPGVASKLFLKPFVTIPVAPVITGIIINFIFYIRCIPVYKFLYFSFSSSFCMPFLSARIATSISVQFFSFQFLIVIPGLFAITSVTSWLHKSHLYVHKLAWARARAIFLLFRCLVLCILTNVNVHQLYRLIKQSLPERGILRSHTRWFLHVVYITCIYCQILPFKCYF